MIYAKPNHEPSHAASFILAAAELKIAVEMLRRATDRMGQQVMKTHSYQHLGLIDGARSHDHLRLQAVRDTIPTVDQMVYDLEQAALSGVINSTFISGQDPDDRDMIAAANNPDLDQT